MNKKDDGPGSEDDLFSEDVELFDSLFKAQLTKESGNRGVKKRSAAQKKAGASKAADGGKEKVNTVKSEGNSTRSVGQTSAKKRTSSKKISDTQNQRAKANGRPSRPGEQRRPVGKPVKRRRTPTARPPTGRPKGANDRVPEPKQDASGNPAVTKEWEPFRRAPELEEKKVDVGRADVEKPPAVLEPMTEGRAPNQVCADCRWKTGRDEMGSKYEEEEKTLAFAFEILKSILREKIEGVPNSHKIILGSFLLTGAILFSVLFFGFLGTDDSGSASKTVNAEMTPQPTQKVVAEKTIEKTNNANTTVASPKPAEKPKPQQQTVQQSAHQPKTVDFSQKNRINKRRIVKKPSPRTTSTPPSGEGIGKNPLEELVADAQTSTPHAPKPEPKSPTHTNEPGNRQDPSEPTIQPAQSHSVDGASPGTQVVQNQTTNTIAHPSTTNKEVEHSGTILANTPPGTDTNSPKIDEKKSKAVASVQPTVTSVQPTVTPVQPTVASVQQLKPMNKKTALYELDGPSYPYSVYLGAYRTLDRAKEAVSVYQGQGLNAHWVKVDLAKKGIWYRIFMGHFRTKKQAETFLKNRQLKDAAVKKTRYTNLIGVFSSKEDLKKRSSVLLQMDYSSYVIDARDGKFQLYTGAFYTKAGAEKQLKELASKKISCMVVER